MLTLLVADTSDQCSLAYLYSNTKIDKTIKANNDSFNDNVLEHFKSLTPIKTAQGELIKLSYERWRSIADVLNADFQIESSQGFFSMGKDI